MRGDQADTAIPALGEASAAGPAGRNAEPSLLPIATLHYQLTAADHAAFLSGTKRHRRRARGTLASAAFASLMALNFLTGKLPVPQNALGTVAELLAILGTPIGVALWKLRHDKMAEATEEIAAPVDVTLHVHSDHAVEHRADRDKPVTHRVRTAHDIRRTLRLVALESDRAALVIPARAFADRRAMAVLVDHWNLQRA